MPDKREKLSPFKRNDMPAVVEAGTFLRSFPRHADEPKAAWLRRSGRWFGLTYAQAKKILYGEVKGLDADTYLRMRDRYDQLKNAQIKRQELLNDAAIYLATVRNDAAGTARSVGVAVGSGDGGRVRRTRGERSGR